eukprot:8711522-Alexandrium_andersonii.AAC.1
MVRLDAAQYFKNANLARGRDSVARLLEGLQKDRGVNAVKLLHPTKALGQLVRVASSSAGSRAVIRFSEIARAFDHATHDKEMLLGGMAIRREGGWPMG